jgi:DNA-binding NarL/FixJ family response regulator
MKYEREARGRTTVLLVDDEPLFTEALELVLTGDERIEVIGRAADGAEAVELTEALRPDVVLMDVHMPRVGGVEATRRIARRHPGAAVVMLSSSNEPDDVARAVDAGAAAYLTKDAETEQLVAAILGAAAGPPPPGGGVRAASKLARLIFGHAPALRVPVPAVAAARAGR